MCLGIGNCTKIPCTFGSALYAATTANTSSSVASSGKSVPNDVIPASSHAFFFDRTYVCESLRSPTSTTASPGVFPVLAFIAATLSRTSSRTVAAMDLPSITLADADVVTARCRVVVVVDDDDDGARNAAAPLARW